MTDRAPGGPDHSMHEERPDPRSFPDEPAMRVPTVLVLSLLLARPVVAEDPAPAEPQQEQTTEEKLEALEQKVKILERKEELAKEAADAAAPDAVTVTAGKEGFTLRGGGGAYLLRLRGYVQADGRFGDALTDTFLIRRARPILEGSAGKYLDFRLMTDFGQGQATVQDAWLDVKLAPWFKVRAGKMKPPVGLERLQSGADLLFVERAHPTSLVPNRDVGIELHGDVERAHLAWSLGGFNGTVDGGSSDIDTGDSKDLAARIFFTLFKSLGVGVGASGGSNHGTATATGLPTYRTTPQVAFFSYRSGVVADGDRRRVVPQATWYRGRFGGMAEYAISEQEVALGATTAELENRAWQVAGSFALTGDQPSYRGISPRKPFDPEAHAWGALELKLRYTALEVDDAAFPVFADPATAARTATTWSGGITWTMTRNLKAYLDYETTSFEGGAAAGDREDENAVLGRLQVSF